MRTTVKATCNDCGDVSLTVNEVVVRVLTGHEMEEEGHQYRFKCPKCQKINLKQTSFYIVSMLVSAGAKKEVWDLPLELIEHPQEDSAPPITLDDVIDLHMELENEEDWMRKIMGEEG